MPKIAHFLSFGIGGADRAAIELLRALVAKGLDITVLYNQKSFPIRTPDQDENQALLSTFNEVTKIAPHIRIYSVNEVEEFGFDLLHIHRSGEDEWLLPGLGKEDRSYLIVETNFHGANQTIADVRIYPSKALMKSKKIKVTDKTFVIPNIVNSKEGVSKRDELGISKNIVVFGRVGRSDRSIYSSTLLEEYARIEREDTLLIWLGKSQLALYDAKRLGITNVLWLDPVDDPQEMANIYQTFDVYLHVNALGETFGNTVAEAVIRGIPVASLRGKRKYPQAQAELLSDGQYCSSRRKFRKLIQKYLDNQDFREQVSKKNFRIGQMQLNEETISTRVLNLYKELLG
jgi:glycosyltransferase involved in cell wall biosynthesis